MVGGGELFRGLVKGDADFVGAVWGSGGECCVSGAGVEGDLMIGRWRR